MRSGFVINFKNRMLSPLAQKFVECAREIAKPLAKRAGDRRKNQRFLAQRS